jgi:hypothetical protein
MSKPIEPLPVTFAEAERLNPCTLAAVWGDRGRWPLTPSVTDRLAALMCALGTWLRRWLPLSVHRAAVAGAGLAEVTAAAGLDVDQVHRLWTQWADRQTAAGYDLTGADRATAARRLQAVNR